MKYLIPLLHAIALAVGCAVSCPAQSIDGPDEVKLMHPAWFAVSGIPDGASTLALYSDVVQNDPAYIKPNTFLFWSQEPGRFELSVIVINWKDQQAYQIRKVVNVIGDTPPVPPVPPDPPTPPDPPVPPDPPLPPVPRPTHWQVWFFRESTEGDDLTLEQHELLSGLKFRDEIEAKGDRFMGSWDVSTEAQALWPTKMIKPPCGVDRFGRQICYPPVPMKVPPEGLTSEVWDRVRGDPMPRVAIAPLDGGAVQDFPLPANVAEFWKLLENSK
jgi:hypothetical protein